MAERRKTDQPAPYRGGRMGGWVRGMDNVHASVDLPVDVLRDALNVHFATSGEPRSRFGVAQAIADPGAHSVFSDGARMVWATANTLKLTRDGITKITVLTSASLATPLSYVALNGSIYFSNEYVHGIINANDAWEEWGAAGPVKATQSGNTLSTDGFTTDEYGNVLFSPTLGVQALTQFMEAPPLGQLLEVHGGRIWIAQGSVLWRTQSLQYGLVDPEEDFLMFKDRITLVKSVDDGLYVAAGDETVFLSKAGTDDVEPVPVFPYGAIEGASRKLPNSEEVVWLSTRGVIVAGPGGQARNVTEHQIAIESAARAAMGIVEQDGVKTLVAVMRDGDTSPLAAADFVAGEATRLAEAE